MALEAPVRSRQSYRHEAFLWRDPADPILAGPAGDELAGRPRNGDD